MTPDELFMRRAFDLALLGKGAVAPNPMVGCVIALNNKIIGEGWHKRLGGSHAEVDALRTVSDPTALREATVYVSLEPCAHQGKTPPCADELVRCGVKRVVIANEDPNPLVNGKGIAKLRQKGIDVQTDLLCSMGRALNRRFFVYHECQRPYIVLKWAQTKDGFMARRDRHPQWIVNPQARQRVHKWRTEETAIMVGGATAAHDNPQLSAREWVGKNPVRVVFDRRLALRPDLRLFDRSIPTLCYNEVRSEEEENLSFICLPPPMSVAQVVTDLRHRNIQSLIVEGGPRLLSLFIEADLWDEARVFSTPWVWDDGLPAPLLRGEPLWEQKILDNTLRIYGRQAGCARLTADEKQFFQA